MIEKTLEDGILTLRLAHGKASALDVELLDALAAELDAAVGTSRAVILTGTGTIFSAGVDLHRVTREGGAYVERFLPVLSRLVKTLFAHPAPVVAAVNGHAIAGGCILTLAADHRLMARGGGRIGVPELLVGVPFPAAPFEVLRFAVPPDKIQALVYTGRTLVAEDALAHGLVDEVVAPESLATRAREVASALAALPAEAFRAAKSAFRSEALDRMERNEKTLDRRVIELWALPETRERIAGYLARTLRK